FSSRRRHTRWPRDWIQTCALPISATEDLVERQQRRRHAAAGAQKGAPAHALLLGVSFADLGQPRLERLLLRRRRRRDELLIGCEIGRASCRERVGVVVVCAAVMEM